VTGQDSFQLSEALCLQRPLQQGTSISPSTLICRALRRSGFCFEAIVFATDNTRELVFAIDFFLRRFDFSAYGRKELSLSVGNVIAHYGEH